MATPSAEAQDPEAELQAQRLGAALLSASESIVAMVSLLVCINIIERDARRMIILGAVGLISGACSRAIGDLVSGYYRYEAEVAKWKLARYEAEIAKIPKEDRTRTAREPLPRPWQGAATSALSSAMGSLVPLLGAAFIKDRQLRLLALMVVSSVALVGLGALSAKLGNLPLIKSAGRVLLGGYLAIGISYCTTKLIV